MPFADRIDAGRKLAQALIRYRDRNALVLALPRGDVEVGAEVADALHASLDLLLVRKIGAPMQPELAIYCRSRVWSAPSAWCTAPIPNC